MPACIHKNAGETPLEALERYRAAQIAAGRTEFRDLPLTYAGRLDPMAEGKLIVLSGDECLRKEDFLRLDKEYEVDIVFGISTDTYDALGMAEASAQSIHKSPKQIGEECIAGIFPQTFTQPYPPYSSKTVAGRQLHQRARAGTLPPEHEMPGREVTIYSMELLGAGTTTLEEIRARIFPIFNALTGDFRQTEIRERWKRLEAAGPLPLIILRVRCSSGTYMRSLAHRLGVEQGTGACALSIRRTEIFLGKPTHLA